jgi:hypothetical protein
VSAKLADRVFEERCAQLAAGDEPPTEMQVLKRLAREHAQMRERLVAIAEVGCVRTHGRHPMKCLLGDPCSFCRTAALLDALGMRKAGGQP